MEIFGRLALYKRSFGLHVKDGLHSQHVCFAKVFEGGNKGFITGQALVPPPVLRRKCSGYKYFVYRRIKLIIGETGCKRFGIFGKMTRPISILEVADPIGHAKMAKVDDWGYVQPF